MLTFKIAFRNIFRQKRRTYLTILTMFGGFTLAAISFGWSDGTYNYVINMFTRNNLGHIQVHGAGYLDRPTLHNTINNHEEIGEQLQILPHTLTWSPRLYSSGLVSVGDKTSGVRIVGIDPVRENNATRFNKKIVRGRAFSSGNAAEVILGIGLAKILKAEVGDEAVIVSQGADGSIANDLYAIVGIAETGDDIVDRIMFYLPLQAAQELLVLEGRIHEMIVIVDDLDYVPRVTAGIRDMLKETDLVAAPWQEFARSFYRAMKADQKGTWIMLAIIIVIVAVGVLNTVLMTVLERTREYGVLRAVGTRPGQIFKLVLYEVATMAVISTIIGAILSAIINYLLSFHGIPMPIDYSYGGVEFSRMYTEINARSLIIPGITVVASAMLISVFPAVKAARIAPAKAMRTH
ncbi:MAG: ABC transporter permease [Candidatus Zixiibacteriota bacterium]|nr:MAG: ABC transporter permease [candidate division Zixibacteria bacterium]